jgi:hypothetical protein
MWSRLYRNHVIMAFPTYDTVANAWAPQADINWFAGSSHDSKFVRFPKRCTTEQEAVTWALRRSEVWVDNRLRCAFGGSGLKLSDENLQKSHAALTKPRNHNHDHWSRLETRRKLEHTRQDLTAAMLPRAAHIPLRQRPWRRFS